MKPLSIIITLLMSTIASFSQTVTGSGTVNYLPKFTSTSVLGNSLIFDNGTNVGIGTNTPAAKLDIAAGTGNENIRINSNDGVSTRYLSSSSFNYPALSYHAWKDNILQSSTSEISFLDRPGTSGFAPSVRTSDILFKTAHNWNGVAYGQYLDNTMAIKATQDGGYVGIGTTNPATKLEVMGVASFTGGAGSELGGGGKIQISSGYGSPISGRVIFGDGTGWKMHFSSRNGSGVISDLVSILDAGYVGIGTATPAARLDIVGGGSTNIDFQSTGRARIKSADAGFWLNDNTTDKSFIGLTSGYPNIALGMWVTGVGWDLNFLQNGNILIGKLTQTNSAYILDVNGNVRANKLTVNTTGADFVFEPNYKLPSLKELELFVQTNHHLPGIAPAKEMQEEGIELGENQTKLLQKVEELTLYLIDQNKKMEAQQNEIDELKQQLKLLKKSN